MKCSRCGKETASPITVQDPKGGTMRVGKECAKHYKKSTMNNAVKDAMKALENQPRRWYRVDFKNNYVLVRANTDANAAIAATPYLREMSGKKPTDLSVRYANSTEVSRG